MVRYIFNAICPAGVMRDIYHIANEQSEFISYCEVKYIALQSNISQKKTANNRRLDLYLVGQGFTPAVFNM